MEGAAIGVIILIVLLAVAVGLLPWIFYLITLSKTIKQCAPHNQRTTPGSVWMVFIPIYGIIWHFMLVGHIADSLAAEFQERNIPVQEQRPGYSLGITFLILQLCGIVPFLGILASLGGLVCWIVYWVKIAGYKTTLENSPANTNFGGNTMTGPTI